MVKTFMLIIFVPLLISLQPSLILTLFLILLYLIVSFIQSSWSLLRLRFDMLSLILVILTAYILILILFSGIPSPTLKLVLSLWALTITLYFMFSTVSLLYFYFSFELSLIPMAIIILGWGTQPERLTASLYILFYTFSSSFPFLVFILALGSPEFWRFSTFSVRNTIWAYGTFVVLLPFLVKMPIFFVHLWLPKAHVEAPAYGSIILAGVLLKIGGYGIWRIRIALASYTIVLIATTAIVGRAIASLITICQVDIKSLIAYSRVVHMGLVIYSLLVLGWVNYPAALIIMVAHGIRSSGLFCIGTFSYERFASRSLLVSRGLLLVLPSLTLLWRVLILRNLRAPPRWNLLSEIYISINIISSYIYLFSWVGVTLIIGLVFSLYLFTSHYHGELDPLTRVKGESIRELSLGVIHSQWWLLSPILFYIFE
jgi:NADH-ubiquinone oxidoreductase chain 4